MVSNDSEREMGTTEDLRGVDLSSKPSLNDTEPRITGYTASADSITQNGTVPLTPSETNPAKLKRNVSFTARDDEPIEPQVIEFLQIPPVSEDEKEDSDHSKESNEKELTRNHVCPDRKPASSGSRSRSRSRSAERLKPRPKAPDGGWGWVILVATFFNYIIVAAIWHSFPVLYLAYSDYFSESLAKSGVIASVEAASLHFVGAIGSGCVERYGSRPVAMVGSAVAAVCVFSGAFATSVNHLYAVYALAGGGIGLSYVSFVVIVQQWFDKRRPIASGFSLTGFSVAVFCLPPITQWLLDHYGWRGCLILMSGVYLNGLVMAALLRPVPMSKPHHAEGIRPRTRSFSQSLKRQVSVEKVQTASAKLCRFCKQVFDFSMFKDTRFMLYGFGTFFMMIGHIAFITHIVYKAERYLGIERHKAMLLPSLYGVSNGVCRILFSLVASLPKVNRTVQYGVWIIIGGVICCLSCLAKTFTSLAITCALFGMCVGSYISIQHPVLVDLLGVERIVRSAGLLQVFIGFAGLLATPFAGWLYDVTDNYDIPYYIIGGLKILGGIIILLIPCLPSSKKVTEVTEVTESGMEMGEDKVSTTSKYSIVSSAESEEHLEIRRRTLSESSYTYY